ncbi:MCE family protein [Actinomadura algeriensis]|uniref:Phospholipid/cholesterol/gamma-HCH transport system substrate-binding protein n=1 Tax=Actinomadura algeriensis TaxID=1679523 RepID=A0ABR9JLZ5_9ACTN|nr:MCE family protein [Actinomadura algeriensis]MBE1531577.1 phospholipid/cholesterol/gamma-HCH transport system substrate-binding protein [Actinomadura algeriensis]
MSERMRLRLLGTTMVLVIVLLLALTVAFYNKAFRPTVDVKVAAERVGLQLLPHSDVKVRGLIVGEVRDTEVTDKGAILHLAIDPDKAELIPRNVQARMLPKTLFGEKYVSLEMPAQGGTLGLTEGMTIQQDRSRAAVEINKVLDDLLPLLRAVKPAELNATLNALATALQGRGDQLGENLEQADALLKKINPELGTLVQDLHGLADVADVYNAAAPDLLQTLRNLNVTSRTITDKEETIEQLIPAVTALSEDGNTFMRQNGPKIIGVNIANRDVLQLVAKYSPTLPCVLEGMVKAKPELERVGGGDGSKTYNLTIEIVKPRPAYKYPLDKPEARDHRNPRCYGIPNSKVPFPDYLALDGTQDDLWWKNPDPANAGAGNRGRALSNVFVEPGSADQNETIKNIVAPLTRTPADELSDMSALMFGPLLQGSVVTVE